jgi:hypothetical protein
LRPAVVAKKIQKLIAYCNIYVTIRRLNPTTLNLGVAL